MKIKCACGCGQLFEEKDSQGRVRKFIKGHFNNGKNFSKETRERMSLAKKGKCLGKNNPMWGKENKWGNQSKEAKIKLSLANKGKNNPNWGKHPSKETRKKMGLIRKKKFKEQGFLNSKETRKKLRFANLGKIRSKETRARISKNHADFSGKNSPMWGRHHSKETKAKQSLVKKGKYIGKNNSNWQNGISFEPYGLEFNRQLKKQIRERDNFTCQECKQTEKKLGYTLICHHIDYNKQNNDANNLISLCRHCHTQTNFDREDWTKYFQKMI